MRDRSLPTQTQARSQGARYIWLLPLLWIAGAALGNVHRGDEYGLFLVGCFFPLIPLAWIHVQIHTSLALLLISALLLALGKWMDRRGVRLHVWLPLWVSIGLLLGVAMVADFDSTGHAIAKNGSLLAYAICGLNMSLWIAPALAGLLARRARGAAAVPDDAGGASPSGGASASSRPRAP